MKKFSAVVVNLQNPREKVWGVLISIQSSGLTVQGIDLNSFDDWSRSVARGEGEMGLSTIFFPGHRIERVHLDETIGSVLSFAKLFEERTGQDVWSYLGIEQTGGTKPPAALPANDWMSLEEAELDYIRRVLEDCDGDRASAAEILGISEDDLTQKLG